MAYVNPQYANFLMEYYGDWLGAPDNLLTAIAKAESSYNKFTGEFNNVCNSVQACGLMQLRPNAIADIYDKFKIRIDPLNPIQAIVGAAATLYITKRYIEVTTGRSPDWNAILAGYNQGWTMGRRYMTGSANDAAHRYVQKVSNAL